MMQLVYPGVIGNGEIYLDVLKAICGNTSGKTMVDLMCHHAPYTPLLGFEKRIYVDILDRGLDHKEEQIHFVQSDVFWFLFKNSFSWYDVMICSDGIEHLGKQAAYELLFTMFLRSNKHIIFTPLGDCSIGYNDHPDTHKSGWLPEDLPDYASIVFPDFHSSLGQGAFFAWKCKDIQQDFEIVSNELKDKTWIK